MIDRYSYSDPVLRKNSNYPKLDVEKNTSSLLKIFRLISGTIDCKDEFLEKNYRFRTNYLSLPFTLNTSFNYSTLTAPFPEEIDIATLNGYFGQLHRNASFYKSIQLEITKCLIAKSQESFLESFFYLYRMIEGICYTIPLIYTSKAKEYKKSFSQLQSFFNGQNIDRELAFFKKFLIEIYKNEDFYDSTIDIDFNLIEIEDVRTKYYNLYKSLTKQQQLEDCTEGEELKFKFVGFYEFLIELRNRYFHFLQGTWQKNLSSTEILYPDLFFKPSINQGINWVSTILFEIIKFDIGND